MTTMPPDLSIDSAATAPSLHDRYCIRCAYPLAGLPPAGNCPECGTAVELSLREPNLASAAPEYLRTVLSGLSFILNGILLMIVVLILNFVLGFSRTGGGFQLVALALSLTVSIFLLLGYWKYTEPDPSQVIFENKNSSRAVIRITVIVQAVFALIQLIGGFFIVASSTPSTPGSPGSAAASGAVALAGIFVFVMWIASAVAWVVQFFSMMRYTRWLATRVPDQFIIQHTKRYMWLLPVLYTVGILLIGLGPVIALILYWNLLDRMRKHFKSIVAGRGPAELKHRLA